MRGPSPRGGVVFLWLTISLVLMALAASVALPRARHAVQEFREDELRFVLGEFRRATAKFRSRHAREPGTLEELLRDDTGTRFLRQRYRDPMTGGTTWGMAMGDAGVVFHSLASSTSLAGMPYSDWR